MDGELIYIIIIIAITIISGFLKSKKKQDDEDTATPTYTGTWPEALSSQPQPMQQPPRPLVAQPMPRPRFQPPRFAQPMQPTPPPMPRSQTPPQPIFEEGQRVTQKRTVAEVKDGMLPARRTNAQAGNLSDSGLHNRENLKRAIIFGEILAPKF